MESVEELIKLLDLRIWQNLKIS